MKRSRERDRHRARRRRGFRAVRTVFSILLAGVLCVMAGYVWGAIKERGADVPAAAGIEATAAPTAAPAPTISPAPTAAQTDPVKVATMATEPVPAPEPSEGPAAPVAEWPARQFPDVPVYPGAIVETGLEGGRAEILLPPGGDAGFEDYAAALVARGASVHLDSDRLTVLKLGDVEIQLVPDEDSPSIFLCGEAAMVWDDPGDDVLPLSGRLVELEAGEDGMGAVLTYRCVSLSGLMDYLDLLRREGWTSTDPAIPADGALFAVYRRGDRTVTVDYYANSSNFQIFLGTHTVQ